MGEQLGVASCELCGYIRNLLSVSLGLFDDDIQVLLVLAVLTEFLQVRVPIILTVT